jgi:hypothetical protein
MTFDGDNLVETEKLTKQQREGVVYRNKIFQKVKENETKSKVHKLIFERDRKSYS